MIVLVNEFLQKQIVAETVQLCARILKWVSPGSSILGGGGLFSSMIIVVFRFKYTGEKNICKEGVFKLNLPTYISLSD